MPKLKQVHLFKCSCENQTEMKFEDFKKHLADAHGLKSDEDLKGKKEMVCHMDGARWYSSTYKWTLTNGLIFTEFFESSRSKSDLMCH